MSAAAKAELRSRIRAARAAEPQAQRTARALRLRDQAPALHRLAGGAGVAAFQPTNDEPDIAPLVAVLARDTAVVLPVAQRGGTLGWAPLTPADLAGTRRGIPTPAGGVQWQGSAVAAVVGLVLVPALAIDPATGHRVGYGAGYYDRLLAQLPEDVATVGVCRAAERAMLAAEPHDVPVRWVLTEAGLQQVPPAPGPATA